MTTERKQWVSWEELNYYLPGLSPFYTIDYSRIGGLTEGSIPFADVAGMLTQDNANLFWDETNAFLGIHETTPTALVHINSVGGAIPALNLESGAEGEIVTPDGQQLRIGHWNGADMFTERMKIDDAGKVFVTYLTNGSVIFAGADGEIQQDNVKLRWDNANKRLGVGAAPSNVLYVYGVGTTAGGAAYGGVVARFLCSEAKHTSISIDSQGGKDAVLNLATAGGVVWDIRNDASETDEFQIRYQIADVNRTDFKIDNVGNVSIPSGTFGCNEITIADGHGLNLQEDISFTGATGVNLIKFPDNLANALSFMEGANPYLTFISTDGSEAINFGVVGRFLNEGLHVLDTNASHDLIIKAGSDLAADRILSLITGDAARTITLSGNPTLDDWFDQAVKQASTPTFDDLTITTPVNIYALSHNSFADYIADEHINWEDTAGVAENFGTSGFIALHSNAEIRFYDNGNYVGFEAPALGGNQIWVLPNADGALGEHMVTDGAGNLSWTTGAGTGNVSAAAVIADHSIVRGDGGAKGVQDSGILIDDNDVMTFPDGGSISLQEDITFLGATTENLIKFPDNLPNALSFMEAANPYQTFITTDGSEAIQFHEDVLLKGSTEYGATNRTTGAWAKSIGGGGDYADWATMIAVMPDLIAHAVTVTIQTGTTLTELCELKNKYGVTSAGAITVQAERYYPTATAIPTADSATATTLRDAVLAAEAFGNDYFNGCWIFIVDGTGTDNGFVLITDYVDATGDVVVAGWPGTQPDNTSRYIIVGALIDCGGTLAPALDIANNGTNIYFRGIGVDDSDSFGINVVSNTGYVELRYCGIYDCDLSGLFANSCLYVRLYRCGIVKCNTDNSGGYSGVTFRAVSFGRIDYSGISDNNQRGVYGINGGHGFVDSNFGDNNGLWGTYANDGAQIDVTGSECSGSAGNHSDPGTAGNASADQASAF